MSKKHCHVNPESFDLSVLPVKTDKSGMDLKIPVHPNLPNIKDGAVVLLVARRGEGKSTLISNLMLNPRMLHKENFDYVFIISNTINQDRTTAHLKKEYEATAYDRYDDAIINDIIKFQKTFSNEDRPRTAILLDDVLGSVPKNSIINFLCSRSRHILQGGLLLMASQTMKSISPVARVNATQIILMRTDNEKELEKFYEEWGSCYGSKDHFYQAFKYATQERYCFCYMNLDMGRPKMFKNFTEDITERFFPEQSSGIQLPTDLNNNSTEPDKNIDNDYKKENQNV